MRRQNRNGRVALSYRALQVWARIAVAVFYRQVAVTAAAPLPTDRPVILAANHGNALADVAIIVAKRRAFPHFLAAASWWSYAPVRALFRFGGVIPIHRRRDGGNTHENASSFAACHSALAAGAHVAIFPEGEMHLEPALLPLKTGAARIALSAAVDAGLSDVVLVPVGLLYEDRGRFRSTAEMRFGEVIEVSDWIERYRHDPAGTVREVTDLLARRLGQLTMEDVSAPEAAVLEHAAAVTLADQAADDFAGRNALRRALRTALAGGASSTEYRRLVAALDAHTRDLARLGLDPRDPAPLGAPQQRARARLLVELAALTAPAAVGVLANAPTLVVLRLASRRVTHDAWQATVKGVGGTVLSPLVWTVTFGLFSRRIGRGRALTLTAAGAAAGLAALGWSDRWRRLRLIARREKLDRGRLAALHDARASRLAVRRCVESLAGGITVRHG